MSAGPKQSNPRVVSQPFALLRAVWAWLIAPSPTVVEAGQRRQAQLMAGLLVIIIPLGLISELYTVLTLPPERNYSGYWVTLIAVLGLLVAYGLSRSRYYSWAAVVIVITTSVAVLVGGLRDPQSVKFGFLDFLLMAVLLGSALMSLRPLFWLGLANLAALLLLPLLNPALAFEDILVGSFTFNLIGLAILVFMRWHRDQLERDRLADLAEKEARYRTLVELLPAVTYLDAIEPWAEGVKGFSTVYLSPQIEALLGYPMDRLLIEEGLWWSRVHPDDRAAVIAAHDQYLASGGPLAIEYRLVSADGLVHWVRDVASLRIDSLGRRLSQGLWLETTDLHAVESRLRDEAARTAALLRVAKRLNALLDLDAVLLTLCEEAQQALAGDAVLVTLYDPQREVLTPAASRGLGVAAGALPAVPRRLHDRAVERQGPDVLIADLAAAPEIGELAAYTQLGIRGLAYASVQHEQQLVGSLVVMSRGQPRTFSEGERLLLRGLADQAALSITNTRLYKDARRRLERLQALRTIDIAITSNQDLPAMLEVLLAQIIVQLDVAAALVLLLDPAEQRLVYVAGRGFRTQALQATRLRWGEGHAGRAAQERRVVAVPDLTENLGSFNRAPLLVGEGFFSYFAAPLIVKGEVRGVLEVFDRVRQAPDPEWLSFLEALAGQAAIAIDSTTLLADLQRTNSDLSLAYDATIEGWSRALDLRDHETEGHSRRVTELAMALAERVGGFNAAALVHLRRGALLHDIGKMGVPDSILLKAGPLNDAEWVLMRQHPLHADAMLRPIEYLRPALDIPLSHHEKWDGTGYPHGLAGEAIPRAARLFAVVDVWDALCSTRAYRAAWPPERVREHLQAIAGTHLDPALVAAFLAMQAEAGVEVRHAA